jgi:dTDP-4-amino-4,6-dideoxygalactose transaminase
MKFIDLEAQQNRIKSSLDQRIQTVLSHGQYINGPEVKELESRLASYVGVKHAIGCASGTDALLMALMACGAGPGDAIFTTPFTFIATAEVISLLGATPVFVDIDPSTFNLDPSKLESAIQALNANDPSIHPLPITPNPLPAIPRGIVAVDLFGLPADYDRINAVARKHGLFVIEDAAQSFGAEYNGGRCCSLADIACTSFFPAKPLGCYGDGGMCFTDDDRAAEVLRSIRVHGMGGEKYDNVRIGINGRLDTLQAAILLAKLEVFPEEAQLRQGVAERYGDGLRRGLSESSSLTLQHIPSGTCSAWAQYSILARDMEERGAIQGSLKQSGIPTAVYYPKPLHRQQAFADLGYQVGDFPVSEGHANCIFSIPMHPYLKEDDQNRAVEAIRRACGPW